MEFNTIQDYFSNDFPSTVTYTENGVYLCKNITPIYSLNNTDEIASYQCLRQCIRQSFESKKIVEENFDLIWKAYGEANYPGNVLEDSIETVMDFWQNQNLEYFNQFLKAHPMLHTDGFYYGVEEEDRNEMSQQLGMYNFKKDSGNTPTGIQWHDKKKACREFTIEEFGALLTAIEQYTIPFYNSMQDRKEAIYSCNNKIDIFDIDVKFIE